MALKNASAVSLAVREVGARLGSTRLPRPHSRGGPGEGCFPNSDLHRHLPQPGSQPPSAVWEVLKRALNRQGCQSGGAGTPLPACSGTLQGAIKTRSLFDWLTRAGTRLLQLAQRPLSPWHPGQSQCQPPHPRQLWAGSDPRACPSRSMSSCWDQPGHILAFESLVSWKESRFGSSSPRRCPQLTLPCHGLWGLWGFSPPTDPPGG